jgi:hypothetical protein
VSPAGDADLRVRARAALLDALEALAQHRDAVVVIGAQAIYLHTGGTTLALAEATKDSDLAVDPRALDPEPLVEEAMRVAGFELDTVARQPGAWVNADGIPVDLMVPEALAGRGGRRSARIPPHDNAAMRRARGLEATVVDHAPMHVGALAPDDPREYLVNVASPAALLVAKLHKIGEREDEPRRLEPKDAHDVYRLLATLPLDRFVPALVRLTEDPIAGEATTTALDYLQRLFAAGPEAVGSELAGRAEELVGDPDVVSASVAFLAQDLLAAIRSPEADPAVPADRD